MALPNYNALVIGSCLHIATILTSDSHLWCSEDTNPICLNSLAEQTKCQPVRNTGTPVKSGLSPALGDLARDTQLPQQSPAEVNIQKQISMQTLNVHQAVPVSRFVKLENHKEKIRPNTACATVHGLQAQHHQLTNCHDTPGPQA